MPELFSAEEFGRLVESLRVYRGIRNRRTLANLLRRVGLDVTAADVRKWERGEVIPTIDVMIGLLEVLEPRGGLRYFSPCVSDGTRRKLRAAREAS